MSNWGYRIDSRYRGSSEVSYFKAWKIDSEYYPFVKKKNLYSLVGTFIRAAEHRLVKNARCLFLIFGLSEKKCYFYQVKLGHKSNQMT